MNTKIFTPICNNGLNRLSTLKHSGDVFLVKNLFNELTKDWEKAKARENLGIAKVIGLHEERISAEISSILELALATFEELLRQVIQQGSDNLYLYISENRYEALKEAGQLDPNILYLIYEGEEQEPDEPVVTPTSDIEISEDAITVTSLTDNILEVVGTVEGDTLIIQIGQLSSSEPSEEPNTEEPVTSNITITDNIINSLLSNIDGDTITVEGTVDNDTLIIIL